MASPEQKHTTPTSLVVDAILLIAFFAYLYTLVAPHVPTTDPTWRMVWGALCAACMTGVFWLCVQMFRVVFRAQREAKSRK